MEIPFTLSKTNSKAINQTTLNEYASADKLGQLGNEKRKQMLQQHEFPHSPVFQTT